MTIFDNPIINIYSSMKMKERNLLSFMEDVVRQLQSEGRYGTAHVYHCTLRRIRQFAGSRSYFPFRCITRTWLKAFAEHLYAQGMRFNSVSTYMRMLRATYNRAAMQGLIKPDPLLFRRMHTGVEAGNSRALPAEAIRRILLPEHKLPERLEKARCCFSMLFLLRGLSFADLAYMRKSDLQDNLLCYHRRKTGRRLCVEVVPEALALLERYTSDAGNVPGLFPFVREQGEAGYRQYRNALRCFNRRLGELARYLGLDVSLSSYCARHSWATIANFSHYDKELISNALGHSSVRVTETYFRQFHDEEIHRMNREILAGLLSSSSS